MKHEKKKASFRCVHVFPAFIPHAARLPHRFADLLLRNIGAERKALVENEK